MREGNPSSAWRLSALGLLLLIVLALLVLWAERIDLPIAALFFDPSLDRFPARGAWLPELLHNAISGLGITLTALLFLALISALVSRSTIAGQPPRALGFALCCLVIGPVVIANGVFKDHWGRARPMQLEQFGTGHARFTPPLLIADQCAKNCSFVSGDPSVLFMLHGFAYIAATRRRRQWLFWGSMAAGSAAGALRIWMGAHFFSDVVFAGVFMVITASLLHCLFFGRGHTRDWWLEFSGGGR